MDKELRRLLAAIQHEMGVLGCWQSEPPAPEQLASELPFCIDTLTFLQWLQWVYVARMHAILDAQAPLPAVSQLYPYAEEALKTEQKPVEKLLALIKEIDSLF